MLVAKRFTSTGGVRRFSFCPPVLRPKACKTRADRRSMPSAFHLPQRWKTPPTMENASINVYRKSTTCYVDGNGNRPLRDAHASSTLFRLRPLMVLCPTHVVATLPLSRFYSRQHKVGRGAAAIQPSQSSVAVATATRCVGRDADAERRGGRSATGEVLRRFTHSAHDIPCVLSGMRTNLLTYPPLLGIIGVSMPMMGIPFMHVRGSVRTATSRPH